MSMPFEEHGAFLELLVKASPKVRKKIIQNASESEILVIIECILNVKQFETQLKRCKVKLKFFEKQIKNQKFNLKKIKKLFVRYSEFVASVVASVLSVFVYKDIDQLFTCEQQ